jgi:hypothetical protein
MRMQTSVGDVSCSVPVNGAHYDLVNDALIDLLVNTCRPLFLGSETDDDPEAKPRASNLSPSKLVVAVSDLLAAVSYKMKEQARQDMAEEDLGGGMFDQDVKDMRKAAGKCNEAQVYDVEEQQTLDAELALHEAPATSLNAYRTGTKLYSLDVADTGSGLEGRVMTEVRAPAEQVGPPLPRMTTNAQSHPLCSQVIAYMMGHNPEYRIFLTDTPSEYGERRSDHRVVQRKPIPMPNPFQDREIVATMMWKKLDENTYFYTQKSCENDEFPARPGVVRASYRRTVKLTKMSARLTRVEMSGSVNMGGVLPRRINDTVTIPLTATLSVGMIQ